MSQLDLLGGNKPKNQKQVLRPSALVMYDDLRRGYRNTWKHGVKPNKDWIRTLNNLSDKELQDGYSKIGDYFPEWPPSHWSFYNLCREKKIKKTKEAKLNKEFTKDRSDKSNKLIDSLKAGLK